MTKYCLKCNKEFKKSVFCSKNEWEKRKYCSHSCANSVNALNNGRQFKKGEISCRKGKKGLSGKKNPRYNRVEKKCLECGNSFMVLNSRKEISKFCSMVCRRNNEDKNSKTNKNERIRKSIEYKKWRELVYERDDWTCQKCLIRGKELNSHHIIGFSDNKELRFDIDNGITLCRECHYKFHTNFGFRNNNIQQLNDFLAINEEE